jgi:CDP-glucose 4,6-dehydratase
MQPHLGYRLMSEFWSGRRVLVTGHTGFKGSWLCLWLEILGAEVHGYALDPPTTPNLYESADLAGIVESTIADIRDLDALTEAVAEAQPEVVLHLAAQSLVLRSYDDPVETFTTNVVGTVNVLEAVRRSKLDCAVVAVTTDKVYENRGWPWRYRENDELGGHDPYSSSKAACELAVRAYRTSFFQRAGNEVPRVAVATARAGNVIGGGDWTPRQLVPDTIAALESGERVLLRHPEAIRPWQHVLDCLGGYLLLAERLAEAQTNAAGEWNFGPLDSGCVPVHVVVDAVAERLGVADPWQLDPHAYADEEAELLLDSTKATRLLGWQPRLTFEAALDWTVDWYRALAAGRDAATLCREQIGNYSKLPPLSAADAGPSERLLPTADG